MRYIGYQAEEKQRVELYVHVVPHFVIVHDNHYQITFQFPVNHETMRYDKQRMELEVNGAYIDDVDIVDDDYVAEVINALQYWIKEGIVKWHLQK